IYREASAEIARLHTKEPGTARLEIVPEDQVPVSVRSAKGNPWWVFVPPFDSWVASSSWFRKGGSDPTFVTNHDPASGLVGSRSEWEDYGAGDDDRLFFFSNNDVGVWFDNPHELGKLDAWIKARCHRARSKVWLDD